MDRYGRMLALRDSLTKLFKLCGLDVQPVEILLPPELIRRLVSLLSDKRLCSYLDKLDRQARDAAEELKGRKIDSWNRELNEQKSHGLIEEMQGKLENMSKNAEALSEKLDAQRARGARLEKDQQELIMGIIALRDNLLLRRDWARAQCPDDENLRKLLTGMQRETAALLEKAGVEVLEETGPFDPAAQTVVETRPADDPSLDGQVAEVFRPGYRYGGESLRVQEVILYTGNPCPDSGEGASGDGA